MQLTQELTFHVGNMRDALGKLKAYRPPKWATLALVVIAFAAGWMGGWARGMEDGQESGGHFSAFMFSIEANERAKGKDYFADRFHAQTVDRQVQQHIKKLDESTTERLRRMTSPYYWQTRSWERTEHDTMMRWAERRLALVPAVRPETKSELEALGQLWEVNARTSWFESTAADYSRLLGRKIAAAQLLPDAYLQEHLNLIRQQRSTGK